MNIDSDILLKRLRSEEHTERTASSMSIEGAIRIDGRAQGIALAIKTVEALISEAKEAEHVEMERVRALCSHARSRGPVMVTGGQVGALVNVMAVSGKCKVFIGGRHFTFPIDDVSIITTEGLVLAGPRGSQ